MNTDVKQSDESVETKAAGNWQEGQNVQENSSMTSGEGQASTTDFLEQNQKEIDDFFAQDNHQSTYTWGQPDYGVQNQGQSQMYNQTQNQGQGQMYNQTQNQVSGEDSHIGQNINHTIDEPLGRFSNAPSGLEHSVKSSEDNK